MIQDNTTIAIVCTCGRRLSVPKHLGGKRIKCVRCSRAIGVPEQGKPAAKRSPKAPPLPLPTDEPEQAEEEERNPAKVLAGILAGLVVALLVLLLLFWFWPRDQQIAGTPDGQRSAQEVGGDGTDLESTATTTAEKESELENSSDAPELDVEEAEKPVDDPAVVEEEAIGASEEPTETEDSELTTGTAPSTPAEETELSRAPAQGGTRKTISGLTQSTMAGVKVYGSIALVCDISGSMQSDLPNLIKELRSNFPADTPLILVRGCAFLPPMQQKPTKGVEDYSLMLMGLAHDPHVYRCSNTTDAILFAARDLKRDTVMFNNDLQDGGSEQAIYAMEKVHREFPFRLSGRSLERDAPDCLLDFIKSTGGDFVVDPIYRSKKAAMRWAARRR